MRIEKTIRESTGRVRVKCFFDDEDTKTEKCHKKRVNINTIMAKINKTGLVPVRSDSAFYGDFSNVGDYQSSLEKVRLSQERFMLLPSKIRNRFDNNPGRFLSFISDKNNLEECYQMGIFKRPAPSSQVKEIKNPVANGDVPGQTVMPGTE